MAAIFYMKILVISQVYWPDTASVSQHLSDLLEALAKKGHDVTVFTSRNNYENTTIHYGKKDKRNGVIIKRILNTSFGKKKKIGRITDFISFNFLIALKMLFINKKSCDLIIGLTSPPLLSFVGIKIALLKKIKFLYWTMDLQPELSIIAGYINSQSKTARFLQNKGDYIFKNADTIVTLDKYMTEHVNRRIGVRDNVFSVPVWPVMNQVYEGLRLNNPFRIENNFHDRIVVMYSGNHAVGHSLDTLIEVETKLKNDQRFLFVHIGSGIRLKDVVENKTKNELDNVIILPYQPREKIHLSLGASDIQVVILGNEYVGYSHPNKIYGAMFIGKPILYIGPNPSHVTDIIAETKGNISVNHDEVDKLVDKLKEFASLSSKERMSIGNQNLTIANSQFPPEFLIDRMVRIIESSI